jgi:PAS domain S-box-containing protein
LVPKIVTEAEAELNRLRAEVSALASRLEEAQDECARLRRREAGDKKAEPLQRALGNIPFAACLKDTHGRVIWANDACARLLFKKTVAEVEGRSVQSLLPNNPVDYFKDDHQVIESRQPKLGIVEYVQIDDRTKLWIQTDKYPWFDEDNKVAGVLLFAKDITQDRQNLAKGDETLIAMYNALKEIEERYYLAFLGAQDGLWDFFLDGSCSFVSVRCKQILGYEDTDIGADYKFWWRKIHPHDRQRANKALVDHLRNRTPYDLAIRLRTKQGHYLWMNARGRAIWDDDDRPTRICGSIRDVTDRIISEQIMQIQYNLAKAMIGSSDFESFHRVVPALMQTAGWAAGAVWLLQPDKTGSRQLKLSRTFGATHSLYDGIDDEDTLATIMRVVDRNELLFEPTAGSTLKRSMFALSQGFKQILIFPLQSGDKVVGAVELFHPDVREYREDLRNLTHLLGTQIGSLVDRLQVQSELKERDHQLSSIVDFAPDGIITLCGQEIITANSAAHRIFGFGESTLIHRTVSEIMPGLTKLLPEMTANNHCDTKNFEVIQLSGLQHDGSRVPVEVSVSSFQMHGTPMLTAILRDITEREQMEHRVSEFYSMVSHELRTPITSIKGSLSLMDEGVAGELPSLAQELVQIARAESDRLLRLINDILDIRKIAEGKLKLRISVNDIDELVGTAIDALKGFAEHENITLVKEVSSTKLIDCDRDRIIQVLANLISNAVKFSSSGANVIVRAGHNKDIIRISVTDSGNGIPEGELKKLFMPFQQLDCSSTRPKGGTGLGLAISKAIVREHGGEIGVESEVGNGTTFWFEIPSVQLLEEQ